MGVRNTLADLNDHLFMALERLGDDDLSGEDLERELKRADGIAKIAQNIINNGNLVYKTMQHMDEYGYNAGKGRKAPRMLAGGGE